MKQRGMEKYWKRIGVTLVVMATLFLSMGQANAIPVVSTLGNSPSPGGDWGNPVGQALTTGQSITVTSATFMFSSDYYYPTSGASLTIKDADSIGQIGPTTVATWALSGVSGNLLTFSGNTTLSSNKSYWFLLDDSSMVAITVAEGTSYVANFGATLPVTNNNYGGYMGTYYPLVASPLLFEVQGNPVPIPGAVWLLGSGLLGLVGLKRRRGKKV